MGLRHGRPRGDSGILCPGPPRSCEPASHTRSIVFTARPPVGNNRAAWPRLAFTGRSRPRAPRTRLMAGSSISTDSLRGGVGGGSDRAALPGAPAGLWLAASALAVVALVAAALIPGAHSRGASATAARGRAPHGSAANQLPSTSAKISARTSPARSTARRSPSRERRSPQRQITSDLDPLPPSAFERPVARYIHYALGVSGQLGARSPALRAPLPAGDRGAGEAGWGVAFTDYLHLGAVYGLLPGRPRSTPRRAARDDLAEPTSPACTGSRWGCGGRAAAARWSRCRRRCSSAMRRAQARAAAALRSTRSITPPERTRSSRTPSATSSAAPTSPGAARACSAPPPGIAATQRADPDAGAAAAGPRQHARRGRRTGSCSLAG